MVRQRGVSSHQGHHIPIRDTAHGEAVDKGITAYFLLSVSRTDSQRVRQNRQPQLLHFAQGNHRL